MNHMKRCFVGGCVVLCAGLALAGDINPPPGPVGAQMLPLDEVEPRTPISSLPFTIDQCGSYFLTDCLTGVSGQNGITIDADDVTLDLNGFTLIGVPGSLDGVVGLPGRSNVRVENGIIDGWDGNGIRLFGVNSHVGALIVTGNAVGLRVQGSNCTISGCTINQNTGDGVVDASDYTVWRDTLSSANGGNGMTLQGPGTVVSGCSIENNGAAGLAGVETAAHIRETTVCANGAGIHAQVGATDWTIADCNISGNAGNAIQIDDAGARITGCHIMGNMGAAVLADGTGCTVRDCKISADGVNTQTLVRIGNRGVLAECDIDVSNSVFVDAPVEISGTAVHVQSLNLKATTTTAPSIVNMGDINWIGDFCLHARDCTLSTTLVDASGAAGTINMGHVKASGTTSAPVAVRCAANNVDGLDYLLWLTPTVPVGLDIVGSSCSIDGVAVFNVSAGGTGIRVSGGNGNTVRNCRISGDGSGAYTGIDIQSANNLVIANDIVNLMGGNPVGGLGGAGNLIGPIITSANFGSSCDSWGNIIH